MYKARVTVTLKPSILDPKGKASLLGLKNLGFDKIKEARIGKTIELDIDADTAMQAQEMAGEAARKLLANEVMEDFQVEVLGGD